MAAECSAEGEHLLWIVVMKNGIITSTGIPFNKVDGYTMFAVSEQVADNALYGRQIVAEIDIKRA